MAISRCHMQGTVTVLVLIVDGDLFLKALLNPVQVTLSRRVDHILLISHFLFLIVICANGSVGGIDHFLL